MSDFSIPGINDPYNTQKTIDGLVKVKSIPLDQAKEEIKTLQNQKSAWQDLNRQMTTLRTVSRSMFSFENPFADRSATSSDASITATASREAVEGNSRIDVLQIAAADRFASKALTSDQEIPEGTYSFQIGEDNISLKFRGGTLKAFVDAVNNRAGDRLKASIIKDKPDSSILVIESLKTGSGKTLLFRDDSIKLGLDLGILEEVKGASADLLKGSKVVAAGKDAEFKVPAGFQINANMVLEYQVRAKSNPSSLPKEPVPPTGPVVPAGPGASVADIHLPDLENYAQLQDWKAPPVPQVVTSNAVLGARRGDGSSTALPDVVDSQDFQTVQIPVGKDMPDLSSVLLHNVNTARDVEIQNVRVYDPNVRDSYKPSRPISTAQNAKLKIDGIPIERDTNSIQDAIPGVTLSLTAPTEKTASIKIEPDRKSVKQKIIEFVADYNDVMRTLNILSARKDDSAVLTEIDFQDDKTKQTATDRLGMFQGDSTLSMIKSRFQTVLANTYETRDGNQFSLLVQAGVSTNATRGSGGVQQSRLRGYLEIDEKVLDKALVEHFLAIKDIFGSDSNNDLLPDRGIGVQIDTYVQPYVQISGILPTRAANIDAKITAKNNDIRTLQTQIAAYEQELKVKYGTMQSTLNQLQSSSSALNNLNNSSTTNK